ncbi:MAG: DNA replication and repair protein RecF [Pseudomonadota bacterium]|nr:DNA replication and repair protein RecF [Pseudomonadota bacterium]
MVLKRVTINNFRSFGDLDISFDPKFHTIIGKNGSGKTSILEAIHAISYGKSFRTHLNKHLIKNGSQGFLTAAEIANPDQTRSVVKYHYNPHSKTELILNENRQQNWHEIAHQLPCIFLDTNTHRLMASQTKWRRDFINFCAYYCFKDHSSIYGKYQKILAQRNTLLKQTHSLSELTTWTEPLAFYGEQLTKICQDTTERINHYIKQTSSEAAIDSQSFVITYQNGYGKHENLNKALHQNLDHDRSLGYTYYGPHRSDFYLTQSRDESKKILYEHLSQGQLKRLAYCLKLAQLQTISQDLSSRPLLLLDDLGAELDQQGQQTILAQLETLNVQVILTALSPPHKSDDFAITTL